MEEAMTRPTQKELDELLDAADSRLLTDEFRALREDLATANETIIHNGDCSMKSWNEQCDKITKLKLEAEAMQKAIAVKDVALEVHTLDMDGYCFNCGGWDESAVAKKCAPDCEVAKALAATWQDFLGEK